MWTDITTYLADIFCRLNNFNSSLQGDGTEIFTLHNKTDACRKKLVSCNVHVKKDDIDMFSRLSGKGLC